MPVPFGSIVAPEIDELVAVARGVFDYQFTATCKGDAFEANGAVADVEVPAVEMHVDAVEAAVSTRKFLLRLVPKTPQATQPPSAVMLRKVQLSIRAPPIP